MAQLIHIAHSPDSDDVSMFYALASGKIVSKEFTFKIVKQDIEELNQLAPQGIHDLTALSVHAFAHVADRYFLTLSGASMAEKDYGPVVVARRKFSGDELENLTIAVPGKWTTAFLLLKMILPRARFTVMPFDKILNAVLENKIPAGLLIHESQLQYEGHSLTKTVSITDYWRSHHGDLPLPLGINAIKKSLEKPVAQKLSRLQEQSIHYALHHKDEVADYLKSQNPTLTKTDIQTYLSWYANHRTLNMGQDGLKAIELLFHMAYDAKLIPEKVKIETI